MREELPSINKEGNHFKWPAIKKVIFLFLVCYSVLFIFPFPLERVVLLVAPFLFNLKGITTTKDLTHPMNGSGDTTYDYLQVFTTMILSVLISLLLFFIDRRRNNYSKLIYWWFLVLRGYLGFFLLFYGFIKIFNTQFPFPTLASLDESYGDSSPMHLMWTFMGYSQPYTAFSGLAEVTAGTLLLFRRTVTLGALITIIVMGNVVMMNFCYDVPVKIASTHMVFFACLLIAPNTISIFNFFFLHKATMLVSYSMPFPAGGRKIFCIIKVLIVFIVIGYIAFISLITYNQRGIMSGLAVNGIYKTDIFICDHNSLPPLATDSVRWNKIILQNNGAKIISMTDKATRYKMRTDSTNNTIMLTSLTPDSVRYNFRYSLYKNELTLNGNRGTDTFQIKLNKVDISKYLLIHRGFHWVNEQPFNK